MLPVDVNLVPDGGSVMQWLAIVVVVSIIAAFIPARRASRVHIREALGYE
jgi:ABC-type lipoprotein release transport system permease subunit